jgi:ABC-type sugar transport system ATPase subunit
MRVGVENLTKRFTDTAAVENFNVVFESGQLISLLGPSGCGKSTMLYMLAGIVKPSEGRIFFDGRDMTDVPVEKRGVGLVFQNYALYPHMSVLQNISFPLEIRKIPREERLKRARELAEFVHVEAFLDRKPGQLSGGQQQRVAIARAMAKDPQILLLDEPLSNLDARLRLEMREEIRRIQRETGITVIFVTHDQEEAMSISDKILLMNRGRMMQYDAPQALYHGPVNRFAANFLGLPPINELTGTLVGEVFTLEDGSGRCPIKNPAGFLHEPPGAGRPVVLAIRAESLALAEPGDAAFSAEVREVYAMGKEELAVVRFGTQELRAYLPASLGLTPGSTVHLGLKERGVFLFDGETGERLL